MPPILRSAFAIVLGAVTAMVLIGLLEAAGHLVYPPPVEIDPSKPETIAAAMAKMPVGTFLLVLVAWCLGTFGGAWVAARVAGRSAVIHGLVLGFLSLASAVATMLMLPHPVWFWVLGIAVIPPSAYLGAKVAEKTPPARSPASTPSPPAQPG